MNIDELATKYTRLRGAAVYTCHEAIRGALTEQAEAFNGELRAYDGTVRELTKTVEDMRAAQSVPAVGDPVAYLKADAAGKVLWSEDCVCEDAVWAGEDSEFGEYSLPVYQKPTHYIPAAELATLREKAAMVDELRKDADRGRLLIERGEWIRRNHDTDEAHSLLAIRLPYGADLSCEAMREDSIDAAIAQVKGE